MKMPSSNARSFFEKILNHAGGSFEFISQLCESKAEENEWLEFKGAYHLRRGKEGEIDEIWSKALGAFANSSGGVLIWGINAPDRCAETTALAVDAEWLGNRLRNTVVSVVEPVIAGVDIRVFRYDEKAEGFVVCFIPQSNAAPHQSMRPQRQFYLRCQDGSHPCPYATLKRLFYPATSPVLLPHVCLAVIEGHGELYHLQGRIEIENLGAASAHDVLFKMEGRGTISLNTAEWEQVQDDRSFLAKKAIHPEQRSLLALNMSTRFGSVRPSDSMGFRMTTTIFARDCIPFRHQFTSPWDALYCSSPSPKLVTLTPEQISFE